VCDWILRMQQCVYDAAANEVATISRLPRNIGLFCKRALLKRLYSAKETILACAATV